MRPAPSPFRAIATFFVVMVFTAAFSLAARAGFAAYTDPGKIDFDDAMAALNPYGAWAQVDGKWTWTPLDHAAPYTNGRWLYSEFGWYWKGGGATSWLTEHYGYWKRNGAKVWTWYPGPVWLPQTVEIRSSSDGIGWRSAEVDADGNFVEAPPDRFTKIEEWSFVTPARFAGPITPSIIAKGALSERLLEESNDSMHSYMTYRAIERPGPHPADFVGLGDGKMFASMTAQELAAARIKKPEVKPAETTPTADDDAGGPPDDPRQVKYWVVMDLPTLWAEAPTDAKRDEMYIYRPDFYQDHDGISRRIALWLDPSLRNTEAFQLQNVLGHRPARATPDVSHQPGVAAVPAESTGSGGSAFSSPFHDDFQPATSSKESSDLHPMLNAGAPTTNVTATNAAPVPDGRAR